MIRTIVIEDEAPAAERLIRLLKQSEPSVEVDAVIESVQGAVEWFGRNPAPDLVLLDIQLADGLSFDIFRQVQLDAFVIFTTAYDEYAIKAFQLNSIDYLLKPVDPVKLDQAMAKFRSLSGKGPGIDVERLLKALDTGGKTYKQRFMVHAGRSIRSIETRSVACFYSREKSVFLCTLEGRHYPLDQSLDAIEELVDPDQFFRISRQYILHFRAIERVQVLSRSRVSVHLSPKDLEALMVSTGRTHAFRQWLDR